MQRASMNIRKWNTNLPSLRILIAEDTEPVAVQKVLGIIWYCLADELAVDLREAEQLISQMGVTVTKRSILQLMARIFDPLGILGPFIVKLKILFQELWRLRMSWDEVVPAEFLKVWRKCCREFDALKEIVIPRHVRVSNEDCSYQLHIFADASPSAYGVVAYLRIQQGEDVVLKFICSKNRISPLKTSADSNLTLPKLELTAALIASRLRNYITKETNIKYEKVFLWTDSKIALHWIYGDVRRWNIYVAKRVNEIRQHGPVNDWKHCPGDLNPADFLTKSSFGKNLASSEVWIHGPSWLIKDSAEWPSCSADSETINISSLAAFQQVADQPPTSKSFAPIIDVEKYCSYTRILRLTASVQRFGKRCRKIYITSNKFLVGAELAQAERYWICYVQRQYYRIEVEALENGKPIPTNSSILTLRPYLDECKILRVGSRLQFMNIDYEAAFPAILPKNEYLTKLIVRDMHQRTLHGGVSVVLCRIREKFWIPRCRQLVKSIVRECKVCQRLFGKAAQQPFAPLPRNRLVSSKPFETTGIDFAGPLYVKSLEGSSTNKVYIMLLTCSTVRAIHLELVPNLTVECCLLALRRFFARRGVPKAIISDNARTFKRASKELRSLGNIIYAEEVQGYIANRGVSWEFIVERAPWWGGFWERLVGSVKKVLKLSIARATLTNEELCTIITEAEAVINNRPLTYMGDDPMDLSPLTPSHFLQAPNLLPPVHDDQRASFSESSNFRDMWKERLKLVSSLWRRWRVEYVQQLRSFHHSQNVSESDLKEGDVVLVHDERLKRLNWKLAVVQKSFPGRDGKTRSCEVRLQDRSSLRRPIQLLYPLELSELRPTATADCNPPPGGC